MTVSLDKCQQLWDAADNLLAEIAKGDNALNILQGIIAQPKQSDSIARRVLWAVYPDSERETEECPKAYELARVYTTCAVALQYYSVAFMQAFIASETGGASLNQKKGENVNC